MNEMNGAGLDARVAQAIEDMKAEMGNSFSLDQINLAELERRTGVSRAKLRRLKANGFVSKEHGSKGRKAPNTILTTYTAVLDDLLRKGITNSAVSNPVVMNAKRHQNIMMSFPASEDALPAHHTARHTR